MDTTNTATQESAAESKPETRQRKLASNQFLKAREQGAPQPKGSNVYLAGKRTTQDPKVKDAVRAEWAVKKLHDFVDGKIELSAEQVSAAKSIISLGKPTLSAITQTVREEPVDEQEIVAGLAHLLSANSGVLRQLIDTDPTLRATLQAVLQGGPVAVNAVQQSTDKAA